MAAIHGLEECIAEALCCESRFGIFQRTLHRNLLWRSADENWQLKDEKVKRIAYDVVMPSWSWMAITGGIQFLNIVYGDLALNNNLSFHKTRKEVLSADLGAFVDCKLEFEEDDYALVDNTGAGVGWIKLDIKDGESLDTLRCVVIGKEKKDAIECYFILAVICNGLAGEYKRVGVGAVEVRCVIKVQDKVLIV
jgi:hypothetical protein